MMMFKTDKIDTTNANPKIRDSVQYLYNLDYLYCVYGESKTHKMLLELEK